MFEDALEVYKNETSTLDDLYNTSYKDYSMFKKDVELFVVKSLK